MAGCILAGDLGATKLHLGLFRADGDDLRLVASRSYESALLGGIEEAVARLFEELGTPTVSAACIGVAGPVAENRARLTNLDWWVDGADLGRLLGTRKVRIVNDLVATALGIGSLSPPDFVAVNPTATADPDGTVVLVGSGTGLGIALLVRCGGQEVALASEGGHAAFAPRDETEWDLRRYLARTLGGRVSVERVVSGPGILNIFRFLVEERGAEAPTSLMRRMEIEDPSRLVVEAARDGTCFACRQALDLFCSAYGAVAGDMALIAGASGGVYLTGGVAAKLADELADGTFLRAFLDKGRLRPFVERVPVSVVLREETAFLGAARQAAVMLAL